MKLKDFDANKIFNEGIEKAKKEEERKLLESKKARGFN